MLSKQDIAFTIKPLDESHAAACSVLEARAFNELRRAWGQPEQPPRRQDWLAYQARCYPDWGFVALSDGEVIGFSMCHIWGALGWVGPVAVEPAWQGYGLGQALNKAVLDVMLGRGCRTISLETWPHRLHNIAFYIKTGFFPGPLTLVLQREIEGEADPFSGWELSGVADVAPVLARLAALTDTVMPGLDYTPLIRATLDLRLGNVYVWGSRTEPEAMAILHDEPHGEGPPPLYVNLEVLVIRAGREGLLEHLMSELEGLAAAMGRHALRVSLSSVHRRGVEGYIRRGYHLIKTRLRMYYRQHPVPPERVDYLSYVV